MSLRGKAPFEGKSLCSAWGHAAPVVFRSPVSSLCQLPPSYVAVFVSLTRAAVIFLQHVLGALCQHLLAFIARIRTVLESSFNSHTHNHFSPSFHFIKQDVVHHNVVILCCDCFLRQQLQAEAMMAFLIQPRLSPFSITPLLYHSS